MNDIATVAITITDVNDNYPVFQGLPYQKYVPEDYSTTKVVLKVLHGTSIDELFIYHYVFVFILLCVSIMNYFILNILKVTATDEDAGNNGEVFYSIKSPQLAKETFTINTKTGNFNNGFVVL